MDRSSESGARTATSWQGLDLQPHPERVSDAYADERIGEKLAMYGSDRPRMGLRHVSDRLKEAGMSPSYRLHYITAVAHLGRLSEASLEARVGKAGGGSGYAGPRVGP